MLTAVILFLSFFGELNAQSDNNAISDAISNVGLNILQIIRKSGYPLERHRIPSEDGYILELHRIPYGLKSKSGTARPAVLIFHGTTGSSSNFVSMGERSMAFALAEAGYDVWLSNARGTRFSRRHRKLSPNFKPFWMFSWHEIAVYDYPASIDYVRNVTDQDKIFFIGHSQGATGFFVMASERPELNDKLRLAIVMSPTVYTKHNKNALLMVICENYYILRNIADAIGLYELPYSALLSNVLQIFCNDTVTGLGFICDSILYALMGYDPAQLDRRLLPAAVTNAPDSISLRQFFHYAQIYKFKRFQKYDHGRYENLKRYNSVFPPEYNISKITAPVAVFYGANDALINTDDVRDLIRDIPNLASDYLVPFEMWNHIDYIIGRDADKFVHRKMFELMSQY